MVNTVLLGVNILLFILLWKKVLRPSSLDDCRDKLFDLRDEVRAYFISRSLPLSDPIYKQLRDLINFHLRFTENLSLSSIIHFSVVVGRNKELSSHLKNQIDNRFKTDDKALTKFVEDVRTRATIILMFYMMQSSLPWLILSIIWGVAYGLHSVVTNMYNRVSFNVEQLLTAIYALSKRAVRRDALEELSYRSSNGVKPA